MKEGYCLKCHQKREMKDPKLTVSRKGKRTTRILKSKCQVCGTTISCLISEDESKKYGGSSRKSRKSRKSGGSRKSRKSRK